MSTQSSTSRKSRKKIPIAQWIRHAIQLIAFLLYPGLFISVFDALRDIIKSIITLNFSLQTEGTQLLILIAVFPITILWGRFFCGYLCSFGAMGDLLHFVSSKLHIHLIQVPEKADRILTKIKYVIFLLIFVFLWIPDNQIDSSLSPWSVFGMLTTLNFDMILSVGCLLLLLIIVGSLFIERFFCRYLCPLGAVFSLVSVGRLFKIRRQPSACINCGKCCLECPAGIPVDRKERVPSGECIDCMKCVDSCPTSCIYANPAPAVAGTAAALSIMGLVYVGRAVSGSLTDTAAAAVTSANQGKYIDGTYTGSGQGYRGTTSVEVTVSGGYITDITVISYADDDEFFNSAKSTIISEILSAQSTDVDTVSGATFSSNGLIDAVADALSAADGDSTASTDTADTTSESAADSAAEDNSAESDSSDTSSSTSSTTDIDPSSAADGTYTGSGTGLRGTTEVSVTVENGRITDITILSYQDDQQFFEKASSTIIEEILSAQSIQVSTVSGATFSSNSILEAVADALGVDWTNPNSTMSSGGAHGGH